MFNSDNIRVLCLVPTAMQVVLSQCIRLLFYLAQVLEIKPPCCKFDSISAIVFFHLHGMLYHLQIRQYSSGLEEGVDHL